MSDTIDYGNLMHCAMRGLIQNVLEGIAKNGLPGLHHFFITFDTLHPDVEIADWLSDRYPEEMTIVVQNWFENLNVTDEGFAITLNFGDNPEPLYIPFDSLKTFVDPSVEFGLRFETQEDETSQETDDAVKETSGENVVGIEGTAKPATVSQEDAAEPDDKPHEDAEVVSLDSFRK